MDLEEEDTEVEGVGNISTELTKSYSSDVDSSFNFQKSNTESVCNDKNSTMLNGPELVLEFLNSLFIILSKLEGTPYSSSSSSSSSSSTATTSSSDCVKYEEERGGVSAKKIKFSRGQEDFSPPPAEPSCSSSMDSIKTTTRTTTMTMTPTMTPAPTPIVHGDSTDAYTLLSQPTPYTNLCHHPREPNDHLCKCNKFFRQLFDIASKFKRQNKFTGIDLHI
jgi:hypothetical protein